MSEEHAIPSTSGNHDHCSAPNRLNFEDKIWRVNNSLSRRHDELKHYWSEARREELKQLKTIVADSKKQYYESNQEERQLAQVINDLQAQHLAKQREIQELEDTDLIYKDLAQAQQKLCLVEEKYKRSTFSNIREEQVQVNEVNRIKRNIAKLAKYIPLVEQRKSLEAQIKADRHKNRTIRLQMRAAQDKIRDSRHKIKAIQTPFLRLREVLADLKVEKRNLIEKYNDERQNYSAWLKHNKVNKTSSTFPSAILQDQSGDSLDLFHVQKSNCKRLIRYLQSLQSCSAFNLRNIDGAVEHSSHHQNHFNDSSDSAEELPESFKHMNVVRPPTQQHKVQITNRNVKKVVKKQAMPLSHGIDYIKMFNDIDVTPPKLVADVPKVLEEDLWDCGSPIPSLFSAGGSECTLESLTSPFTSPQSLSRTESFCSLPNKNVSEDASNSPGSPCSSHRI
uniref:Uncharacterized protein n=1 Tax=Ditylenchus dipsaci TaxID=166011 RepID=A0A915DW94_9BILA